MRTLLTIVFVYTVVVAMQIAISKRTVDPATIGPDLRNRLIDGLLPQIQAGLKNVETHVSGLFLAAVTTGLLRVFFPPRKKPGTETTDPASGEPRPAPSVLQVPESGYVVISKPKLREIDQRLHAAKKNVENMKAQAEARARQIAWLERFRFTAFAALVFALAHPLTALLEQVVQALVPADAHHLLGYTARFFQSLSLCLFASVTALFLYRIYNFRTGDSSKTSVALLGAAGIATSGALGLLTLTPSIYTAISARNWHPFGPDVDIPLFTYLVIMRLVIYPAFGLLGAWLAWLALPEDAD